MSFYDVSDVDEASKTAYDEKLTGTELKARRKRDWLFLLIGIPAFIALIYLLAMLIGNGR